MTLKRFGLALREVFIQLIKSLGLIYLEDDYIKHAILSDAFDSFEEIFFEQVYFDAETISSSDIVIDLGVTKVRSLYIQLST